MSAEVRRGRFIEAAVRTIARYGVDGTTTRRIAGEADAPLAALHYCFQSKRNLLIAVFDHLAELIRAALPDALGRGVGAGEASRAVLTRLVQWSLDHEVEVAAGLEIVQWTTRHDPDRARRAYAEILRRTHGIISASADSTVPASVIVAQSHLIIGLADGLAMQLRSHRDPARTTRDMATAIAMLDRLLQGTDRVGVG